MNLKRLAIGLICSGIVGTATAADPTVIFGSFVDGSGFFVDVFANGTPISSLHIIAPPGFGIKPPGHNLLPSDWIGGPFQGEYVFLDRD